jgi:transposase
MGTKARQFTPVSAISLEALVPADHFYRHLDRVLDLGFVRGLVRDCYVAGIGRPSVDPVVFFRLQLVTFFEGIRSERQLLRLAADRLSVRWFLGYHLDEPLPDHSSLTRIRARYGLDVVRRFFEEIVERCRQAGLVWGRELYFDATTVNANADLNSLVRASPSRRARPSRPTWRRSSRRETRSRCGRGRPPRRRSRSQPRGHRRPMPSRAWCRAAHPVAALAPGLCARPPRRSQCGAPRLDRRGGPPAARGARRLPATADVRVSTTDPDATPMRLKGGGTHLGYQAHYVVDGGKRRIILGVLVAPGEVMENQPMLDLLWRVRFRWRLRPRQVTGDTKYGTLENIRAVEDMGTRAYVPLPDWEQNGAYFGASRFTYDAGRDRYVCPNGQVLRRTYTSEAGQRILYRARASTCRTCPLRAQCTPGAKSGRSVWRSFGEEYLERVRAYQSTAAYQKALRKRQVWVEPLFAEAKEWHGLRRFRLRRLWRVNSEALMIATGQNLKRLLAKRGWGQRPLPSGVALAIREAETEFACFIAVWMERSRSVGSCTRPGRVASATRQPHVAA